MRLTTTYGLCSVSQSCHGLISEFVMGLNGLKVLRFFLCIVVLRFFCTVNSKEHQENDKKQTNKLCLEKHLMQRIRLKMQIPLTHKNILNDHFKCKSKHEGIFRIILWFKLDIVLKNRGKNTIFDVFWIFMFSILPDGLQNMKHRGKDTLPSSCTYL